MEIAKTLIVTTGLQGLPTLVDQIAAIRWSMEQPYHIVVADPKGAYIGAKFGSDVSVYSTSIAWRGTTNSGWYLADALRQCQGPAKAFAQVILLAENTLFLQPGVDTWLAKTLGQDSRLGLLGVQDLRPADDLYRKCIYYMKQFQLPHERFETPPPVLDDAFIVLSRAFVQQLVDRDLLTPAGCTDWPGSYGQYISWAGRMLGQLQVNWGTLSRQIPPLYVTRYPTSPMVLRSEFKVFARVCDVAGYDEQFIRAVYQKLRGESGPPVAAIKPKVTGGLQP